MRISSDRIYLKSSAITTPHLQQALSKAIEALPTQLTANLESATVRQVGEGLGQVEVAVLLIFVKPVAERLVNKLWDAVENWIRDDEGDDAITNTDDDSDA